jgi:hypothetical protein
MHNSHNIPWKRISIEAATIVGSILLAFAIDAWWDQRAESTQERDVLETLLVDMRDFQLTRREGRDEFIDAIIESARVLLDIAKAPDGRVTDREIDYLLNDLTYMAGSSDLGIPMLNMLFESGEIATLENDDLRACLAGMRFAKSVENKYAERETEFVENIFYPYLDENASLAQIWGADDGQPGDSKSAYSSTEFPVGREAVQHSEYSHRELLGNRQFQNILIRRILTLQNSKGWEEIVYDVDAVLDKCMTLIEETLAE